MGIGLFGDDPEVIERAAKYLEVPPFADIDLRALFPKQRGYTRTSNGAALWRSFGLSLEAYEFMLELQKHVCAICDRTETARNGKRLAVDHCHRTDVIRGVLCSSCNPALGALWSPEVLATAAAYIRAHALRAV